MRAARAAACAAVLLGACLAGCSTIGSITGAVAGVATGAATGNPAAAIGVGIGVKTATDAVTKKIGRRLHQAEQDRIAAAAGELGPDQTGAWQAPGTLGFGRLHGQVRVTREIDTPLASCREIVFSVARGGDDDRSRDAERSGDPGAAASADVAAGGPWYAASVCRQADRWKWAGAEPAVARWGNLQ